MSEWREDWEAIKQMGLGKFLYYRLFYRRHMLALHKRGGHVMKHYGPMLGGGEFDKCDWCGHFENIDPAPTPFFDFVSREASAAPPTPSHREGTE